MLTRILIAILLGVLAFVIAKFFTDERTSALIGLIVGVLVFLSGISLA